MTGPVTTLEPADRSETEWNAVLRPREEYTSVSEMQVARAQISISLTASFLQARLLS